MGENFWWIVVLVVISLLERVLKARSKTKKRKTDVEEVENATPQVARGGESIIDSIAQAILSKQSGQPREGDPAAEGVAEVSEGSGGKEFFGSESHGVPAEELVTGDVFGTLGAEMVRAGIEQRGVESSYSTESPLGMREEVISHMGYEAGDGIITDVSEPLSALPTEEGGEGLAAQKAKEIMKKEEEKMRVLARERSVSLGREVLANPRMAMLATFIFETKFRRRGQ